MENQHRLIKGFRDLTPKEIELMNLIKAKGDELGALLQQLDTHLEVQKAEADAAEKARLVWATPQRWLAIARTDIQTGIMAAVRAVAQPTTF